MTEEERVPFVPLPLVGNAPPSQVPGTPGPASLEVVYVRYRDPEPLEFPGAAGILAGPVFHAAGLVLREDEKYLALGEVAFVEENEPYASRYGRDLFPAYRHVLTIPKASVLERRTVSLASADTGSADARSPGTPDATRASEER